MQDDNKQNLLYFENASMRGLYEDMKTWQREHHKRLLATSVQKDADRFCCIALTNPTEVVICDGSGGRQAEVENGLLRVYTV